MQMMYVHTANYGLISDQETPDCGLVVPKLIKNNSFACIAITRQLKSTFC
jgi:hypothetical protein